MITTIRLKRSTKARLAEYGKKDQSYDAVLVKLMNDFEELKK